MTVRELIGALSELDPDLLVVLAEDEGGNGEFSPLGEVDGDNWAYENIHEKTGQVNPLDITKELLPLDPEAMPGAQPCVVLYPIRGGVRD